MALANYACWWTFAHFWVRLLKRRNPSEDRPQFGQMASDGGSELQELWQADRALKQPYLVAALDLLDGPEIGSERDFAFEAVPM